jgi:hypothetical protein
VKCENCGKEFSNKIFNLHINRCKKEEVKKVEKKVEVKEAKKSDKKKVK